MPPRLAAVTRAAAVAGASLLALAALTSCSGDGEGVQSGSNPRTRGQVADTGPTNTRHQTHHRSPHPPSTSVSADGGGPPPDPSGAELGDTLQVDGLQVRALDYLKAGFAGAATGTRVDVVTVEECAEAGSVRVQHQSWRLLDADGHALGAAGGKIVNGNPTEDLPQTLVAGQCLTTRLAIGVPAGTTPVAVQDGPDDTWLLTS